MPRLQLARVRSEVGRSVTVGAGSRGNGCEPFQNSGVDVFC